VAQQPAVPLVDDHAQAGTQAGAAWLLLVADTLPEALVEPSFFAPALLLRADTLAVQLCVAAAEMAAAGTPEAPDESLFSPGWAGRCAKPGDSDWGGTPAEQRAYAQTASGVAVPDDRPEEASW